MKEQILKQFEETNHLYKSFGENCKRALTELLNDNNIYVHHISVRTKDKPSLTKKIDSKEGKYNDLSDITDICGIRIITYLESDVNKVAELIEKEFQIDKDNSIDKRKLKSDQFGYRSVHFVVSFDEKRSSVSENKKYVGLKSEIQVRSILQHAWAEIEHDLGYKAEITIPEDFKRNFNRLAALLETADIEFDRLKRDLTKYEDEVQVKIQNHPDDVLIDQASIISFMKSNKVFTKARNIIVKNTSCEFVEREDFVFELERFSMFKIETIGQLESLISQNEKHYLSFVNEFTKAKKIPFLYSSVALLYFLHYLAGSKNSVPYVKEYFEYGTVAIQIDNNQEANYLVKLYNSSKPKLK
ncbi:MAG: RelA/SpoT domain-containing protein [Bacteroidota bacterium]